jgi:Ca2+-binding EF-hand superfamily protein
VEPTAVLSAEELELLQRRFARFNPNSNKTRALTASNAIKLFRDEFPSMSEFEVQGIFEKCDLNSDGRLALQEYLQTRAYYRLVMEAESELDIVRSFTILDTDNDGVLVAEDVLALVEQAKQCGTRLLKQVIVRAARATREATMGGHHQWPYTTRGDPGHISQPKGEITLEHFAHTIRDINRDLEQEIATKTLRVLAREDKLESLQQALQDPTISAPHRTSLLSTIQSTRVEVDVLKTEVARCKKETLSSGGRNSALGNICETLVASYENEQHVYECLSNLITYCGLKDPIVFRYNLEQSGRDVHVLDSVLMAPPLHVKVSGTARSAGHVTLTMYYSRQESAEYMEMLELAIHHVGIDYGHLPNSSRSHSSAHRSRENATSQLYARLQQNSTLRRQFVYYTMLGDVTNLVSMTRCTFLKFVKDCELHRLPQPPLSDPDIDSIFSHATSRPASSLQVCSPRTTRRHATESPRASGGTGMVFADWLVACNFIFQRAFWAGSEVREGWMDVWTLLSRLRVLTRPPWTRRGWALINWKHS